MEVKAKPEKPTVASIKHAVNEFVARVARLTQVKEIRLARDEDGATIWTVIEAPPFELLSEEPIYEAELEVLRDSPDDVLVDVRVLNITELPAGEGVEKFLPAEAKLIWHRQDA